MFLVEEFDLGSAIVSDLSTNEIGILCASGGCGSAGQYLIRKVYT